MESDSLTDIQQFYEGKAIFVTGGTGFLGHLLLTKLLRDCPGVKSIYVLVREKKNVSPEKRFQELFPGPILEKIRENCPDYKNIIKMMAGDCLVPNLGLSEDNLTILKEEVDVIFHVAATINFTAPLQDAALLNVGCTEDLLNIATGMKNLKVFLHVSTVFANYVGREVLDEKLYNMPIEPEKVIKTAQLLDRDMVSQIQPAFLGPYPNTYVYTKTLAEGVCKKYWSSVPVVIFRPAIVLSTFKEPFAGWINAIHGPVGIFASATLGILRTMMVASDTVSNVVPCDYVINCMIASAYAGAKGMIEHKENQLPEPERIYNFGSSCLRDVRTWGQFLDQYRVASETFPSSKALGTYSFTLHTNRFLYQLYVILFHLLPAFVLDTTKKLFGGDSRLMIHYKKIHKLTNTISSFVVTNWYVKNNNTERLYDSLSERDKTIFFFDLNQIDWDEYIQEMMLGIRMYILKEDIQTLPSAKRKRIRLLVWNRLFSFLFTAAFFYIFYTATVSLKF